MFSMNQSKDIISKGNIKNLETKKGYFEKHYYSSIGNLYPLPKKEPEKSWYDWHIDEGKKLKVRVELK